MSYNGWTNYETWAVALCISSDRTSQAYWTARASEYYRDTVGTKSFTKKEAARFILAEAMQEKFEEANPLADQASVWADLLMSALSEVNWDEVAGHYIDKSLMAGYTND